jgi:DNA-binding NarL/FixJ family response regulator
VLETSANMDSRTRVLLVEDQAAPRSDRRALLATLPTVEVVGDTDGVDAQRSIGALTPDIVVIDIESPRPHGLETAWRAAKMEQAPKVIALATTVEKDKVRQALIAGASGYLTKDAGLAELQNALATVGSGGIWLSPAVEKAIVEDFIRSVRPSTDARPAQSLTPRQLEVLQLIAEGHATKQIAKRLKISVKTVETHRAQIMERLEIRHIAGLVRYALRTGIVPADE